jgi:hypothetical protein
MRVVNLAHQRPASAFPAGGWYLDTPLFQGLIGRAVDKDKPDAVDGTYEEGGVEREESQGGNVQEERRAIFFPPSLPPQGGRKETVVLIVVDRWL